MLNTATISANFTAEVFLFQAYNILPYPFRSVKEYCRWMIEHPEHRRPPYLSSLGLFDPAVLDARLTFEAEYQLTSPPGDASPHDLPAPIELIHRKLSEIAETN